MTKLSPFYFKRNHGPSTAHHISWRLYQITSRGNEGKAIFKFRANRQKFLAFPESATERICAAIHRYCPVDNHYNKRGGTPFIAINERCGLGESSVSKGGGRRLDKRKAEDAAIKRVIDKIESAIKLSRV